MLTFHVLLFISGVLVAVFILKVIGLYRNMKIKRTVMTPMLLAGIFITLEGVTELSAPYTGEIGHVVHAATMFLAAAFFFYGIYSYHQMLKRASQLR